MVCFDRPRSFPQWKLIWYSVPAIIKKFSRRTWYHRRAPRIGLHYFEFPNIEASVDLPHSRGPKIDLVYAAISQLIRLNCHAAFAAGLPSPFHSLCYLLIGRLRKLSLNRQPGRLTYPEAFRFLHEACYILSVPWKAEMTALNAAPLWDTNRRSEKKFHLSEQYQLPQAARWPKLPVITSKTCTWHYAKRTKRWYICCTTGDLSW